MVHPMRCRHHEQATDEDFVCLFCVEEQHRTELANRDEEIAMLKAENSEANRDWLQRYLEQVNLRGFAEARIKTQKLEAKP